MSKIYAISQQQRSDFVAQMNKKWQRKHQREEAWLDYLDSYNDSDLTEVSSSEYLV